MDKGYVCVALRSAPPVSVRIEATEMLPMRWVRQLADPAELQYSKSELFPEVFVKHVNALFAQEYEHDGFGFTGLAPEEAIARIKRIEAALRASPEMSEDEAEFSAEEIQALYERALDYSVGSTHTLVDHARAFQMYLELAQLGFAPAYASLAMSYALGQGVEQQLQNALDWAHRAIEAGQLAGYGEAARVFVLAGDSERATEMWEQCFREVHLPFIDRDPEALMLLFGYASTVLSGSIRQCHSVDARSAFAAAVEHHEASGFGANPQVRRVLDWLRERAL